MAIGLGLILGIGGILLGNLIEGGNLSSLMHSTAAFIVFGGTFGAVLISNRGHDIKKGFSLLKLVFGSPVKDEASALADQLFNLSSLARRESILAIEAKIPSLPSEQMKSVFRFVVDGVDIETLKSVFTTEAHLEEKRMLNAARIWMDAGSFAPTIGIIGAVLGLIHVMANLTDTSSLGKGIATAFVATVYGVGSANLIFIPIAQRLQRMIKLQTQNKMLVIEGAVGILSGMNPFLLQEKLKAFTDHSSVKG